MQVGCYKRQQPITSQPTRFFMTMQFRWWVKIRRDVQRQYLTPSHTPFQCQTAALDELFGNPEECFNRYQSAQILLHSLAQKCTHPNDKMLLSKCKFKHKRTSTITRWSHLILFQTKMRWKSASTYFRSKATFTQRTPKSRQKEPEMKSVLESWLL